LNVRSCDFGKQYQARALFFLFQYQLNANNLICNRLLGKTKLPLTDVLNREGTEIPFKVNLRDGDNNPIEVKAFLKE
jgi:hypothetical protein